MLSSVKRLRLGSISYLNSLPVDFGLIQKAVPVNADIIQGVPAVLNQAILDSRIDIAPVSLFWYALHSDQFLLLPNLSISSESGVRSVLLFSRYPIQELKDKKIGMTSEGRTTPVLFEVLCRKFYGFKPELTGISSGADALFQDGLDAFILIGDEALRCREALKKDPTVFIVDLAEEWRQKTNLPFVFAVWVVRRDLYAKNFSEALQVFRSIELSKKWGEEHPREILREAKLRSGFEETVIADYFSQLSYDWSSELEQGAREYLFLAKYFGFLNHEASFEKAFESDILTTEKK